MSLLDEFSKQLSSATEQLNRLERMENEQQENSENAITTQQKQQSRSKQQRTPYGAGGYGRLHERKTLSSEAAKPTVANIDPIAAKHLQPHPIRYAKTTITDRLDSNYKTLSSIQDKASPTRIAVENDRNKKKFEYLNNKIKALDERVSSLVNTAPTPSANGMEAMEFEIKELKESMSKIHDLGQLRSEEDPDKGRYASPSLQMDHIYDVVYSRLRTQLHEIVHEAFKKHSDEQMKMIKEIVENATKPSQDELLQRIEALEEELMEARTELHTMRNGYNEDSTVDRRLLELRDMCNQIDKDYYNSSKQLHDKVRAIETSLMETKIDHEQAWAILESRLEKSVEKSSIAQTSANNMARVVDEKISDIQNSIAVVSRVASKASILQQSPSLASPVSPRHALSISTSPDRSPGSNHQQQPLLSTTHQEEIASLKASLQQVLEQIDDKLQSDSLQIENFKDSLNILDTRLTRTENAFIKNIGSNGNGHIKNVPSSMISAHVNREFESKFENLLSKKLNESWGAFGLNATIDEIRSDVLSLDNDLRGLKHDVDENTRNRSKIVEECVESCNSTTQDLYLELHRELQVVAKAILHLSGHASMGPDEQTQMDEIVHEIESTAGVDVDVTDITRSKLDKTTNMFSSTSPSSSSSSPRLQKESTLHLMNKTIKTAPSNAPMGNKFDSIKCSPRILIKASEDQHSIGSMMISNGSQSEAPGIAYRLQVTHPEVVLISQENIGFVSKGQSIMIQVVLRPLNELELALKSILMSNDMFVEVEVAFLTEEDFHEDSPNKFWNLFDLERQHITIKDHTDSSYKINVGIHIGTMETQDTNQISNGSSSSSNVRRVRISP